MDDTYGMSIGDELITPAADADMTSDLSDMGLEIGDPLLPDTQIPPEDVAESDESGDPAPVPTPAEPAAPAVTVPDLDEPTIPAVDTDDAIVAPEEGTHGNAAAWTADWFF